MARNLLRVLLPLGLAAASSAQVYPQNSPYPGQNPGGQYPSQYPTNSTPMGLPIPRISLPKRSDKNDKNGGDKNASNVKVALRAMDGTLRELGDRAVAAPLAVAGVAADADVELGRQTPVALGHLERRELVAARRQAQRHERVVGRQPALT